VGGVKSRIKPMITILILFQVSEKFHLAGIEAASKPYYRKNEHLLKKESGEYHKKI